MSEPKNIWGPLSEVRYSKDNDIEERDAKIAELERKLELARTALERLTKVGPPSKSTSGSEWSNQCLIDNCEIARDAVEALSIINDNAEIAGVNVDTRVARQALADYESEGDK